jgi:hypothetical protein
LDQKSGFNRVLKKPVSTVLGLLTSFYVLSQNREKSIIKLFDRLVRTSYSTSEDKCCFCRGSLIMIAATHVTHANPSIELWLLFIHANQGYAVRTRPHVPFWTYAKDFFFYVFVAIPPFHKTCVPFGLA